TAMAGGQSVTTAGGSQQQPVQQGQGQGQVASTGQQQQQQMKAQLKAMKLAPSSKPQGIDPTVIKEREHRYVLMVYDYYA
ncbi:MAG: hypothetical protein MJE68_18445, partial [Proteobacteria bacterium]|nr:hypothetical protein [Pseudomonadota bacterium]